MHNYFTAMGIPILRGRGFTRAGRAGVAAGDRHQPDDGAANSSAARIRSASGSTGTATGPTAPPPSTVIGVIGDVRHSGLEAEPAPELYTWYLQNPPSNPFIVVRGSTRPGRSPRVDALWRPRCARRCRRVDKNIAAYDIRPMAQVRAESVAQRRFVLLLVGAFGVLALVMAAVGVYGVMALIVSERTPEIGIRLALGAQPGQVLRAVVAQGATLAAAGIVVGLLLAAALAPLVATQLYGVRTLDPPTMAARAGAAAGDRRPGVYRPGAARDDDRSGKRAAIVDR